jgi:hypothetical protein
MHNFLAQLRASFSKSPIYEKPEENSLPNAIGYIAVAVTIIAFILATIAGFRFLPALAQMKVYMAEALEKFPADLKVELKKGALSMNQPSPYIVPVKAEKAPAHKNFIVIDTDKTLDFKAFESYDTYVFATKDGYMAYDERGAIKAQTFKNFPDFSLSKESVEPYKAKTEAFLARFSVLGVVIVTILLWILLTVIGFVGTLAFSVLGVLFTLAVTKLKGHDLSFPELFALSLYSFSWVIAIGIVRIFVPVLWWVYILVFLVVLWFFVDKKAPETPVDPAPTI